MTLPADSKGGAAGFTLIETIIVLAVLGLMAGLLISRGPPHSRTVDLRSTATRLVQAMRSTRAQAIASGEAVQFSVAPDGSGFSSGNGKLQAAAKGVALRLQVGGRTARAISFLPDGGSSGGSVALTDGDQRMAVTVSWLTGRITLATQAAP